MKNPIHIEEIFIFGKKNPIFFAFFLILINDPRMDLGFLAKCSFLEDFSYNLH